MVEIPLTELFVNTQLVKVKVTLEEVLDELEVLVEIPSPELFVNSQLAKVKKVVVEMER